MNIIQKLKTRKAALEMLLEFSKELYEAFGNAGCNDFKCNNTKENRNILMRALEGTSKEEKRGFLPSKKDEKIHTIDSLMLSGCVSYLKDILQEIEEEIKKLTSEENNVQ